MAGGRGRGDAWGKDNWECRWKLGLGARGHAGAAGHGDRSGKLGYWPWSWSRGFLPLMSKRFPGHPRAMSTRPPVPVAASHTSPQPSEPALKTSAACFLKSQGTFSLLVFLSL